MKTEKSRNTRKTQAGSRPAKGTAAKAGIKMRSGLRAGVMGFTDKS